MLDSTKKIINEERDESWYWTEVVSKATGLLFDVYFGQTVFIIDVVVFCLDKNLGLKKILWRRI